ncbi:NUDIX hydrolase [Palleronia sp. LCG004]|uniref:NUDIX hydrolase n=1 Tax=Palleronia sp. LCG004 TaxID=3079304 RepID=UPI0029422B80|nr:NUDIX hydrolase [Palleronia sp. LCG004]WOI55961.1 NUDIX hydrolase [Palleronia sp. LCG004]
MIRRFGDPPRAGRSYIHRPGAYAILLIGREILLTRQDVPEREFQLPGGGIDPGEQPLHALHREVLEETGWHIGRPRHIGAFRRFAYMPDYGMHAEKLCHIYLARPARAVAPPSEPHHCAVRVPAHLAPDMLGNPGDAHFLRRVLYSLD